MNKDVLVTIKGLQNLENTGDPEEVELVAKGDYYFKNGHHYIPRDFQSLPEIPSKLQKKVWK